MFICGLTIFLNSKDNIIILFIISELLNLSGVLNYIEYIYFFQSISSQAFILILFSLGAAEAAIGLTIIINFIKLQNTLSIAK